MTDEPQAPLDAGVRPAQAFIQKVDVHSLVFPDLSLPASYKLILGYGTESQSHRPTRGCLENSDLENSDLRP